MPTPEREPHHCEHIRKTLLAGHKASKRLHRLNAESWKRKRFDGGGDAAFSQG